MGWIKAKLLKDSQDNIQSNEKRRLAVLKFSLKILRYHSYIPVFKENFALQYSFLIWFRF